MSQLQTYLVIFGVNLASKIQYRSSLTPLNISGLKAKYYIVYATFLMSKSNTDSNK